MATAEQVNDVTVSTPPLMINAATGLCLAACGVRIHKSTPSYFEAFHGATMAPWMPQGNPVAIRRVPYRPGFNETASACAAAEPLVTCLVQTMLEKLVRRRDHASVAFYVSTCGSKANLAAPRVFISVCVPANRWYRERRTGGLHGKR